MQAVVKNDWHGICFHFQLHRFVRQTLCSHAKLAEQQGLAPDLMALKPAMNPSSRALRSSSCRRRT